MSEPVRHTIPAATIGGYLVQPAAVAGQVPLIVAFHGYGESAATILGHVQRIAGASDCVIVAVEPLHRFYNAKTGQVVGSWMTLLDREQAIEHNVRYVASVLDAVKAAHETDGRVVYVGFSQGASMAYRAAARSGHPGAGLIALGGDVPPDVASDHGVALPPTLIGRGTRDEWYSEGKLADDLERLGVRRVAVEALRFEGGHEWADAFVAAAGVFLARVLAR